MKQGIANKHVCRNNTGYEQPSWQLQTGVAKQLHGEPITLKLQN
jgi:hypothetical protein